MKAVYPNLYWIFLVNTDIDIWVLKNNILANSISFLKTKQNKQSWSIRLIF